MYKYLNKLDLLFKVFLLFPRKKRPSDKSNKVLILKMTEQGSSVYLRPYLKNLCDKYEVHWLSYKNHDIIEDYPIKIHQITSIFSLMKFFIFILKNNFHLILNLENYRYYPHFLHYFLSYNEAYGFYLNSTWGKQISLSRKDHIQKSFHRVFQEIGITKTDAIKTPSIRNWDVVLYPNTQDQLKLRKWGLKQYQSLEQLILKYYPEAKIAIVGIKEEENLLRESFQSKVFCDFEIFSELLEFYSSVKTQVTSDGGALHFSSLKEVKNIALFGPESDIYIAPPNSIVVKSNVECSPCFSWKNQGFPSCKDNVCMQKIKVDSVFHQWEKLYDT